MTYTPLPLFCYAHRGGRGHATENTLEAIEQSLAMGIEGIEVDVWLVAGKLLITHDRLLGRVIKGSGRLLDVGESGAINLLNHDGSRVPQLADVLSLVGDKAKLNIELKGPGCSEAVAMAISQHCTAHALNAEQYVISSFDHHQLFWFKQNAPQFPRAVLVDGIPLDLAACCEPLGATAFNPGIDFINEELINDALNRGLEVNVYTVNEPEDFAELSQMGITGVFCDYPERVVAFNKSINGHR